LKNKIDVCQTYTPKNVITEVEKPAIISTGAGILLCAKKDF